MSLSPGDLVALDECPAAPGAEASDLIPTLPAGATTLAARSLGAVQDFVLGDVAAFGFVDPTGVLDSSPGFAAAMASGRSFRVGPGTFLINSPLAADALANHGQLIIGAGATDSLGQGAGKTLLRPGPAVTNFITVDGTAFGGYVQSFGIRDLTIDLGLLADVGTNTAIRQVQAFDCRYQNVRVINDGAEKVGWLFETGAYTTVIDTCIFENAKCLGTSTSDGVTTLTFLNCDAGSLNANYTNSLTVLGGAWQGATNTKFKLRNGCDYFLKTDVEGGGVFLDVDATVNGLWSFVELQGFTGTYQSGTMAPASFRFDQQTSYNTYPASLGWDHVQLNAGGVAGSSSFFSGATGASYFLSLGRTAQDAMLAVSAVASDFVSGCAPGDIIFGGWNVAGSNLYLTAAEVIGAKLTAAGFNTFGTGSLNQGSVVIQPAADTDVLTIRSHAGTLLYDFNTQGTASNSEFNCLNGAGIIGYTDSFVTQSFRIITATGQALFTSAVLQPLTDGLGLQVSNSGGAPILAVTTAATASASTLAINQGASLTGYSDGGTTAQWSLNSATGLLKQNPQTLASLPAASASDGGRSIVNNSNVAASGNFGAVVASGGTNTVPVYSDGVNWRIG